MTNIAYVNGDFVPESEATISIFDRGFLFADAVYEMVPVVNQRLLNRLAHRERLTRSLGELRLSTPLPLDEIERVQDEIVSRNSIQEGRVYLQITRGPAERDFAFPVEPKPSIVLFGREAPLFNTPAATNGIKVKTTAETRWCRRDIKTVMLLPGSMAKQQAIDEGFGDVWFVEHGFITEGSANNTYIVKDETIYTPPLSNDLLAGCTRRVLVQLAQEYGVSLIEQAFSLEEAHQADEAFLTSASTAVTPVVQVDEHVLSNGVPGPVTRHLQEIFEAFARSYGED